MARAAKGRWIEGAIAQMIQPSGEAAQCFRHHDVTACTDVTGFGLLGHLGEMVTASQVAVALDLTELPVLAGARETLGQGYLSSLYGQNLQAAKLLENAQRYSQHPDYPLLFDPKRRGGCWWRWRAIAPRLVSRRSRKRATDIAAPSARSYPQPGRNRRLQSGHGKTRRYRDLFRGSRTDSRCA